MAQNTTSLLNTLPHAVLLKKKASSQVQTEIKRPVIKFQTSPTKGAAHYASTITRNVGRTRWKAVEEDLHTVQTERGKTSLAVSILGEGSKLHLLEFAVTKTKHKKSKALIREKFGEGILEV